MSGSGVLDRLRARFGWLDHLVRAYQRFDAGNGGFLAAGLTYYTTLALFPVLMVGFSVFGVRPCAQSPEAQRDRRLHPFPGLRPPGH